MSGVVTYNKDCSGNGSPLGPLGSTGLLLGSSGLQTGFKLTKSLLYLQLLRTLSQTIIPRKYIAERLGLAYSDMLITG